MIFRIAFKWASSVDPCCTWRISTGLYRLEQTSSDVCFLRKEDDAQGNVPDGPEEKKINPFPRESGNADAQWFIQALVGGFRRCSLTI